MKKINLQWASSTQELIPYLLKAVGTWSDVLYSFIIEVMYGGRSCDMAEGHCEGDEIQQAGGLIAG